MIYWPYKCVVVSCNEIKRCLKVQKWIGCRADTLITGKKIRLFSSENKAITQGTRRMEAKALRPRARSNFPTSLFPILPQDENKELSTTTIQWISSL